MLGVRVSEQELPAHAEMAQQGVSPVESQPEVLAPAPGVDDRAAGEAGGEVVRPGEMAAHRARIEHGDVGDGAANDVLGESAADDLDLGKLRHSGRS